MSQGIMTKFQAYQEEQVNWGIVFNVLKKGEDSLSENTAEYILIYDYLHLYTENIYYLDKSCDMPFARKWSSYNEHE